MQLVLRLLGNMAGIWITSLIVSSVRFTQQDDLATNLLALAAVALVLTFVNSLIRPVVKVIGFPLYVITFGLFALITNALIFSLTGWLAGLFHLPLQVDSFGGALLGGTITAIISALVVAVLGSFSKDRY
ncbi:phage holin family protein [Actinomyces sp. F1_1611]|uniref:Phage holin family protein n=2 Tax=Scrofimicrobium appendicitidis TaxID=3079930 RepID=A0AAU7V7N7_9ACTO